MTTKIDIFSGFLGAGKTTLIKKLIEEAYRVVDGHCGCGDETCCYGCIANYYNQMKQARLSPASTTRWDELASAKA